MPRWLKWFRAQALSLGRAVWMCRASITVGVVLVPMLGKVPQAIDAVQSLSEDFDERAFGYAIAMVGCAWTLWYCARLGTYMHAWPYDNWARWIARASGLFPCVGIAWGVWNAGNIGQWHPNLVGIGAIALCSGGLVVVLSASRRAVAHRLQAMHAPPLRLIGCALEPRAIPPEGARIDTLLPLAFRLLVGLCGMAAVVLVLLTAWPALAVGMGTVTLVLVAAMGYAAVGTGLVACDRRSPLPVLVLIPIWAGTLGYFGCSENHDVRVLPPSSIAHTPAYAHRGANGPQYLPAVLDTFSKWLAPRGKRWQDFIAAEDAAGRTDLMPETPVVLICAEGGGIYAAFHTAMVLATIQDRSPRFAEHVFAISGVSGGSVGASLWVAALEADRARTEASASLADGLAFGPTLPAQTQMQKLLQDVLGSDLLSRVLAYGLGIDFLQAIIPAPIGWADRARQLEYALEEAAEKSLGAPVMASAFNDLWPGNAGLGRAHTSVPYLFLNTTCVETGGRVMISPLSLAARDAPGPRTLPEYTPDWNVRLSTAAVLSARFPYVTPAGRFPRTFLDTGCPAGEGRLADGGYFDNAGATTLHEILAVINTLHGTTELPFRVIVLRIGAKPSSRTAYQRFTWPDLLSPPRTLLNTRGARGREAVNMLRAISDKVFVPQILVDPPTPFWSEFLLDTEADSIPLGWVLSEQAQNRILAQCGLGEPGNTRAKDSTTEAYLNETVNLFRKRRGE